MADPKAIFDEEETPTSNYTLLDTQPACVRCGQTQRIMKCCTRCHASYYCSRACFAKHWPVHKSKCQPNVSMEENMSRVGTDSTDQGKMRYKVVPHEQSSVPPHINFQKAADALKSTTPDEKPEESEENLTGVEINLRYSKQKHKFKVCDAWSGGTIFSRIAAFVSCLPEKMKIIHKGKQLSRDTVRSVVSPGAVFQVIGEKMEDADGLVPRDIEVLMQQMGVERNVAVKALKKSDGDLIDAMMAIGNK